MSDLTGIERQAAERPVQASTRDRDAEMSELLEGPTVFLVSTSTPAERAVIDEWIASARPVGHVGLDVCPAEGPELGSRLDVGDDPLLVPVKVAWMPQQSRTSGTPGLMRSIVASRRPMRMLQARAVQRDPHRCRVILGQGAHVAELRARWQQASATSTSPESFATFVSRQAALALDRSERSLVGERYKEPRFVAETLADEPRFRAAVADLSRRLGTPAPALLERATDYLGEIVATQNQTVIDLFSRAVRPTFANAWTLRTDTTALASLRELNNKHALVFLPSHRSYADSWLLASILREHDFPRNHTLGGANMGFWPLGPVMRRSGYVLVRRSFRDDELYKLVVREYLGYLVSKRFNLEWYIEGGRSRTGKLRPPRMGLMHYLVDAVQSGRAADVYLVPVSINFDQLAEVGLLAAEEQGQVKKAENALWFARFIKGQQRNIGQAQVRFAEPMSLRQVMAEGGSDRKLALEKVAFEVSNRINGVTPVTTTALLAITLLGSPNTALSLAEIRGLLVPLLEYVARRGLGDARLDSLKRAEGVLAGLEALRDSGVVTSYDKGVVTVYRIAPGQHKVAAYVRNTGIHWFVNRAIVEVTVLASTREQRRDEDPISIALSLRDLLKYEFFFPRKRVFRDELLAELELLDPNWQGADLAAARRLLAGSGLLLAPRVLRPFFESYLVAADRLVAQDPSRTVDQDRFLSECGAVAEQYLLQGRLQSPEAVSREAFTNAFKLAGNRGLLQPGSADLQPRRQAFKDELSAVVGWIDAIDRLRVEDWATATDDMSGAS